MNDNMVQLLNALAAKFGTTAEQLWDAMIRQAPISSGIRLFIYAFLIILICGAFRFLKSETVKAWDSDIRVVISFAVALFAVMFVGYIWETLELTLAGFYNPEYWVLHKLLTAITN